MNFIRLSASFSLVPRLVLLVTALVFSVAAYPAQGGEESAPLTVAVAECPPFVIVENGRYSGLAIFLWEQVGQELGLSWEYAEYPLGSMLELIKSSDSPDLPDVGVSCMSITAEREKLVDFTHSFNETYTAIAVRETTVWAAVKGFFSRPEVLSVIGIILAAATLIGIVFYLLEHRVNKKLFAHHTRLGRIIEPAIIGLMFVSNGPIRHYRFKTLTGRVLATLLTLFSTLLIAAVTAVLASSFTINLMESDVRTLDDLRRLEVAALEASTSSDFLRSHGIPHQTRQDLDSLVIDLDAGVLDAIVSDAAFLQYRITRGQQQGRFENLVVLPNELDAQNYAFVLAEDDPLRESINRALLNERTQREWRELLLRYFGEEGMQ